jgi:hypothetical protein
MKEPNGTLVMTTCKCRENTTNLVMTRTYFTEMLNNKIAWGAKLEQDRIINLLIDLKAIRRCAATNKLVAFDTNGEKVIYLTGLEND